MNTDSREAETAGRELNIRGDFDAFSPSPVPRLIFHSLQLSKILLVRIIIIQINKMLMFSLFANPDSQE